MEEGTREGLAGQTRKWNISLTLMPLDKTQSHGHTLLHRILGNVVQCEYLNQEVDFRTAVSLCNNNKKCILRGYYDDKNELILSICNFKQKKSDSRLVLKQKLVIWGEHVIRITLGRSLLCSCFPAPFCCRRHILPHAYPRSLCHGQDDAEETARGALAM